jgi:hypothetical protein
MTIVQGKSTQIIASALLLLALLLGTYGDLG